ncbi:Transcription factor iws1 [Spiromyces aspiralis]|uniref:Transcription factor iws1 n=1 Tax=Spiromyces aspiralis TaxID=68401 RepID=A0ACC1HP61_9FUNG|nr:Transcription factor iws1 [Spiromyces aspiralis]
MHARAYIVEIEALNRQIDSLLKSKRPARKRKGDDIGLEQDESVQLFKESMIKASERDHEDHQDHLPAIHKLQLLPYVSRELNKPDLHEVFLDNNILTAFRLWLEPFEDGALPSIDIQNTLLELMLKMPIQTDHLRSSGVGKVVLFMSKCPRLSVKTRRMAEQLVQNWSRPILRRSKDYRHRTFRQITVGDNAGHGGPGSMFPSQRLAPPAGPSDDFQHGPVQVQSTGGTGGQASFARIPRRNALSYDVVPTISTATMQNATKSYGTQQMPSRYRNLREKMLQKSKR